MVTITKFTFGSEGLFYLCIYLGTMGPEPVATQVQPHQGSLVRDHYFSYVLCSTMVQMSHNVMGEWLKFQVSSFKFIDLPQTHYNNLTRIQYLLVARKPKRNHRAFN